MAKTNRCDDLGEVWMVDEHYEVMAELIARYNADSQLLEIGSYQGRSAIHFLTSNSTITLHCLDHFKKSSREVFLSNAKRYGVAERIRVIEDDSAHVAEYFEPASLDFVYLDGSHRTEDVRTDLHALRRLLKRDALVLGDDWQMPTVQEAVRLAAPAYELVWSMQYLYLLRLKP